MHLRRLGAVVVAAATIAAILPAASAGAAPTAPATPGATDATTQAAAVAAAKAVPGRVTLEQARANAAKVRIPPGQPGGPDVKIKLLARPYGGELVDEEFIRPDAQPGTRAACSIAYNTLSSDGRQFPITAGHCTWNEPPVSGKNWYPTGSFTLLGDTGHRSSYDVNVGDFGAIRANRASGTLYRNLRQPASGAILDVAHADNPIIYEQHTSFGGTTKRTYHGFVSYPNTCAYLEDPKDYTLPISTIQVCNLMINQIDVRAEGCPQPGDSGSPGTTQTVAQGLLADGVVVAKAQDEVTCWVWETRLADAMTAYGLHSAPLRP